MRFSWHLFASALNSELSSLHIIQCVSHTYGLPQYALTGQQKCRHSIFVLWRARHPSCCNNCPTVTYAGLLVICNPFRPSIARMQLLNLVVLLLHPMRTIARDIAFNGLLLENNIECWSSVGYTPDCSRYTPISDMELAYMHDFSRNTPK